MLKSVPFLLARLCVVLRVGSGGTLAERLADASAWAALHEFASPCCPLFHACHAQVVGWQNVFAVGDCNTVKEEKTAALAGVAGGAAVGGIVLLLVHLIGRAQGQGQLPALLLGAGPAWPQAQCCRPACMLRLSHRPPPPFALLCSQGCGAEHRAARCGQGAAALPRM